MHLKRHGIPYHEDGIAPCNWAAGSIEEYAGLVAKHAGFAPGDDVLDLVSRYGGRCLYEGVQASAVDDGTIYVHGRCDFDIVLPTYTSPRQDRYTIAHELAHYFLHSQQGRIPLVAYRLPHRASTRAEWEASVFAQALLMPLEEIRLADEQGLWLSALAARFDVPEEAVALRVRRLHGGG